MHHIDKSIFFVALYCSAVEQIRVIVNKHLVVTDIVPFFGINLII